MNIHNSNLQYLVTFLVNAGERIRAIRLVMDCTGLPAKESAHFVDSTHKSYGPTKRMGDRAMEEYRAELLKEFPTDYPPGNWEPREMKATHQPVIGQDEG
jgi:hypothetical protein